MLGFWQAGMAGQPPTADLFVLAVDEFSHTLMGPAVLVLDDAAIHKARVVQDQRAAWGARGLRLLFLPPYGPKRNKIERRWHRGKHYWLRSEDYGTDHTLLERVEYIPSRVGTKYAVAFT